MNTFEDFLSKTSKKFVTKERDNGEKFVCYENENETDLGFIRDCHGIDFLPDDFRHRTILRVIDSMIDTLDFDCIVTNEEFQERCRDIQHELCDSLVDIHNHDLLQWLASNLQRVGYVDEAQNEGLIAFEVQTINRIMVGQFQEIKEIFNNIVKAIVDLDLESEGD